MDLVILAAGMGSRFGGLKQAEPIDENGNFIIDYSIFDAIKCGFDRVVFIIKREHLDLFKKTVGSRIEQFVDTAYVFQENTNVPEEYNIPENRKKPLGTTHALLCAAPAIKDDFIVINADDFYGYDAFKTAADFLKEEKRIERATNISRENNYAVIGYEAAKTIGDNGSVKRGICTIDDNYKLTNIEESVIGRNKYGILCAVPLDSPDQKPCEVEEDTPVSMNMFSFKKSFTEKLQSSFNKFLETEKDNLATAEIILSTTLSDLINDGSISIDMCPTIATWYGMTYKEDKEKVVNALKNLVQKGEYPSNLWAALKTKD